MVGVKIRGGVMVVVGIRMGIEVVVGIEVETTVDVAVVVVMNKLYITGEINDEAYNKFSMELRELELKKVKRVDIELISEGGMASSALAFFDRIISSPSSIHITATGLVASAATLILAAGSRRTMTVNAWVMTHEDTATTTKGLMVSDAEREIKHLRRLEVQWNHLLSTVTRCDSEKWAEMNAKTTYLSAKECLKLGLIEEIV